jgi:subtilisin family serine protease
MFSFRLCRGLLACILALNAVSLVAQGPQVRINVVMKSALTQAMLNDLARLGQVRDTIPEINAVLMNASSNALAAIKARPYVAAANVDAERTAGPIDTVAATNFLNGISMWNLDAVDVTNPQPGPDRTIPFDGAGVYVAVLDSGLLRTWRQYFPQERIATQFAKAFAGAAPEAKAEPSNQWERDTYSHGTHVTSTILGFNLNGTPINGVAPLSTVIPIKVLGQHGFGWSSMIARGIVYAVGLKRSGALGGAPLVISMSLGGGVLDAVEQAAVDFALAQGVPIVAASGNAGDAGMAYPAAYEPVVSVASSGWRGEWLSPTWWFASDVADPTNPAHFYISEFSGREKDEQDLDVAAPGSWVVGPYQVQSAKPSYYFLGGTSMSTPHVSGIVAMMLQKNSSLSPLQIEGILQDAAIALPPGCANITGPDGVVAERCWGPDATGHGIITASAALAATP